VRRELVSLDRRLYMRSLLVLVMEPIVRGGGRFCPRILVGGARSVAAPQTLAGRGSFLLLSY